jgi:predicted dehydrogenase
MKVAILGAGLIGCERISALQKITELQKAADADDIVEISAVYDPNLDTRYNVSKKFQVPVCQEQHIALLTKPDWVFVCTPHDAAEDAIKKSFECGASVLVEKPLGRHLFECNNILKSKPRTAELNVGFNYRFFDGVEALLKDCKEKKFGRLISVNMTLAHGNSPGMEKSWKLDPIKCGGGCLIDPGVHLLDLILRISSGNINVERVKPWQGFWKTGIEEEVHMLMTDEDNAIFNVQVSLNRWRSTFRIEVNGTEGYGIVEGRGRSYGPQSYKTGVRWGWQSGKSQTESEQIVVANSNCQDSFLKETVSVLGYNIEKHMPQYSSHSLPCDHIEALQIMSLLDKCRNHND